MGNSLLRITHKGKKLLFKQYEICYCHADGCYTRVYLISGKSYLLSKPLKDVEGILGEKYFFRCHRSYLVNMKHIQEINPQNLIIIQELYEIPITLRKMVNLLVLMDHKNHTR